MDTIFDKILKKEIPAKIVHEDDNVMAFHDVNPQAPVHVLVIPKQKTARFSEFPALPADQVGKLFQGAALVAEKLGLEKNGYRIVVNCGRDGQQTVEYVHVHILGGRGMHWPPG